MTIESTTTKTMGAVGCGVLCIGIVRDVYTAITGTQLPNITNGDLIQLGVWCVGAALVLEGIKVLLRR